MEITFDGQVALVTGAAAGIGLATAQAFAETGAAVTLADLDIDTAQAEADKLVAAGHRAIAVACDVADERQVADMVARTVAEFGGLHAAFNNAGVMPPAVNTADADTADFDRVTGVNQRGIWACMHHELRHMRDHGGGTIVNCSSIGGLIGIPGAGIYHGAKHAVLGMTKSAALEFAAHGIRINAVCPGTIDTPMVARMVAEDPSRMDDLIAAEPIGRLGRPDEIANAVLWLCSPLSSYVVGHALAVDGGYTAQ
ncbi:glucose 1-dehydrogenase [Mycolicibacterium sp. 3033]|nr:glucose 1-dehydrogenase [Mycolicibacterium aurantiacum]